MKKDHNGLFPFGNYLDFLEDDFLDASFPASQFLVEDFADFVEASLPASVLEQFLHTFSFFLPNIVTSHFSRNNSLLIILLIKF